MVCGAGGKEIPLPSLHAPMEAAIARQPVALTNSPQHFTSTSNIILLPGSYQNTVKSVLHSNIGNDCQEL